MMNPFFFRNSSLNAGVRSMRSHSASLSTRSPFAFPLPNRQCNLRERYGSLRPRPRGVPGPGLRFLGPPRRPHEEGDYGAADHDRRDDVEGQRVAVGGVYDAGDQDRSEHAAEAPGGEHEAVDLAHVGWAEVVGVERGHRPEAAAVARDYDEGDDREQEVHADERQDEEKHSLQQEHDDEDPLPAYGVREPGPEEPPQSVADGDDAYQARRHGRADAGDLLRHRRGLGDDGDAGADVEEQQRPQRVPLPGPESSPEVVIDARAVPALALLRLPTLGLPALRGVPHEQGRADDHHEVDDPEDGEGREDAHRGDERVGYERRHEGAAAEAGHGDARDEAPLVREPLDQRCDRHDVAEPDPRPRDEAVGEVQERQAVPGEARQEDAYPVEHAGGQGHDARSRASHPQTAHEGGEPQSEDRDAEREVDRGRRGAPVLLRERVAENAPGVDRPERDLHHYPRYGYDYPVAGTRTARRLACHLTPPPSKQRYATESPPNPRNLSLLPPLRWS